jgi:anaerobic selenocysteine-containing dehydrogenase
MVSAHHGVIPRFMTVPPAFFRRAVLEETPYPIKGFYAMGSNAMLSYADSGQTHRALEKLDFIAVADLFMTPTAAMADVVLPVASQFEINDIGHYGLGHGFIVARPKIVEPPAACRSDMQILSDLGRRLSPPKLWHDDAERFLDDVLGPSGLSYAEFAEKGYLKGPERFRGYEEKGFRTPTGKVELRLSTAEKLQLSPLPAWRGLPEEEDPGYPLLLTSAKSRFYLHSSYRWVEKLRRQRPEPRVELHPETAAAHGIGQGDPVVIETRHGRIVQQAHLVGTLHPRVLCAAHGWWFPEGDPQRQYDWDRANLNMLTSTQALGKEFGTPNLKGLGCRIRRG